MYVIRIINIVGARLMYVAVHAQAPSAHYVIAAKPLRPLSLCQSACKHAGQIDYIQPILMVFGFYVAMVCWF